MERLKRLERPYFDVGTAGTDIERNAVHGSDAPETAAVEIASKP